MKRIFLSLCCAVLLAACTNETSSTDGSNTNDSEMTMSNASVDPANAPVFKFEKEAFDFGQITEGEKVSYDFKFKNTGKSPLIISNATATCGCTVPEYPRAPLAPGEEGVIKVLFNSAGKPGMQNKVVTITANTIPETTELVILGNVLAAKAN